MFGSGQSNELSVLDSDDGSVSPEPQEFRETDCTIRIQILLFCDHSSG